MLKRKNRAQAENSALYKIELRFRQYPDTNTVGRMKLANKATPISSFFLEVGQNYLWLLNHLGPRLCDLRLLVPIEADA